MFERGFVLALGAAAVVRVVLDADGHSTDLHAGRKGIAARDVVDLPPILACSVFPALDLGASINVVGSVGHVLERFSALRSDLLDRFRAVDCSQTLVIRFQDLRVLRVIFAVAVERGLEGGLCAVLCSGDLTLGAADGNPRDSCGHVVIRHGELVEAIADPVCQNSRRTTHIIRGVKNVIASGHDAVLIDAAECDAAHLVLVAVDAEDQSIAVASPAFGVARTRVLDAPAVLRAADDKRIVCIQRQRILRHRVGDPFAVPVVRPVGAHIHVDRVIRAEAELHGAQRTRCCALIEIGALVHRCSAGVVEAIELCHHRITVDLVDKAVSGRIVLKRLDHGLQACPVRFGNTGQVILHVHRVILRAAQTIPRGKNCLVPCLFLHAQLVALILRHRVVVRFELVDELNRRAVELRQILGEFRHLRPEIGKVLSVRLRSCRLERLDAGLRSQLCRVSGSSVLSRVDAVHAGLVERFNRLPIGLREALLRIVRILIRFLELRPQIVLDLREVCLRLVDGSVNQNRAAVDERRVVAVEIEDVDELPARLIDGHGERAVRAGLELRVGQNLGVDHRFIVVHAHAAEDVCTRGGLCFVVCHVGGHGCL